MADRIQEIVAEEEQEKPYDASDPVTVNTARKKESRRKGKRLEIIKAIMDLPQGRRWMYELLTKCHVHSTPFVAADPYSTAFQAGEQNIGLQLLVDIIQAAPDRYVTMCADGAEGTWPNT